MGLIPFWLQSQTGQNSNRTWAPGLLVRSRKYEADPVLAPGISVICMKILYLDRMGWSP